MSNVCEVFNTKHQDTFFCTKPENATCSEVVHVGSNLRNNHTVIDWPKVRGWQVEAVLEETGLSELDAFNEQLIFEAPVTVESDMAYPFGKAEKADLDPVTSRIPGYVRHGIWIDKCLPNLYSYDAARLNATAKALQTRP